MTINIIPQSHSAVTYSSGGYSISIPIPGEYTMTATIELTEQTVSKTFTIGTENIKVDIRIDEMTPIADWTLY